MSSELSRGCLDPLSVEFRGAQHAWEGAWAQTPVASAVCGRGLGPELHFGRAGCCGGCKETNSCQMGCQRSQKKEYQNGIPHYARKNSGIERRNGWPGGMPERMPIIDARQKRCPIEWQKECPQEWQKERRMSDKMQDRIR